MAKEENEKEKNKPKPCPKWLNNTAKKEWRRVAKILAEEGKDFTDKDLKALEAYCINYATANTTKQAGELYATVEHFIKTNREL